jgi:beta-glucanase (GH16 family)
VRGRFTRSRAVAGLAALLICAVSCSSTEQGDAPNAAAATWSPEATRPSPSPTIATRSSTQPWAEDFSGEAGVPIDRSLFRFETGGQGWGNEELETYTDRTRNASLDGRGHLVVTALREPYTGGDGITRNFTSARITTLGLWAFEEGTLSARIKVPVGRGLWPAFWLLGTDIEKAGWPASGEIDIVETIDAGETAYATVHGPDAAGRPWQLGTHKKAGKGSFGDGFHVYSVQRRPGVITTAIDGVVVGQVRRSSLRPGQRWVFDKPMYALLNIAVGGRWPSAPNHLTPSSASMYVDWLSFQP